MMMKHFVKNSLYVIGVAIMIAVFVATGNQLFLHAQDEGNSTYSADATQDEGAIRFDDTQITTADMTAYSEGENSDDMMAAALAFTLEFHDDAGNPLTAVSMYVNGTLRSVTLDENGCVDVESYDNLVTVEPLAEEGYEYTPNVMTVNMNDPQPIYAFTESSVAGGDGEDEAQAVYFSFPEKTAAEEAEFLRNQMAIFAHGETARIALRGFEYAHLFYGINETIGSLEVENYVPYEGWIEISEREGFEVTNVCAFASMDLDAWTEDSQTYCIQVKFTDETADPTNPDDPNDPSDPDTPTTPPNGDDQQPSPENKEDLNQPGITYEGSSPQLQTSVGGVNTADTSDITL